MSGKRLYNLTLELFSSVSECVTPKGMARLIVFVSLYLTAAVLTHVADLNIRSFSTSKSCNLQTRLDAKCAQLQSGKFRSIVECSVRCGADCVGVSFLEKKQCYVHLECSADIILAPCSSDGGMFNFFVKDVPCFHRGVLNESSNVCKCVGGWVGDHCERPPSSCKELVLFGYNKTILTYIKPNSLEWPFKTVCTITSSFISTMIMLTNGYLVPNRTYQEYVDGFYVNDLNFWIGLNNMKALNADNLNIFRIDTIFGLGGYNSFSYIYDDFLLGNATSGYRITFGVSEPVGSGLEYNKYNSSFTSCKLSVKNASFSTADNDNDGVCDKNCAALAGIGWWFTDCNLKCNPLGGRKDWLYATGINITSAGYAESMMYFTQYLK